jgi:hypothetical protein
MNTIKCGDCVFFDQREKFTPRGPKPAWYGWCAKKSIYPHRAPDGMVIPEGATRAAEDATMSSPVIVDPKKAVVTCTEVVRK